MADPSGETEYPINAVSKLTGVSCHALRVWERRYGFPVPHRSPAGHRRYGLDQVVTLRKLSEWSRAGQPIGELIAALRAGRLAIEVPAGAAEGAPIAGDGLLAEFLAKMLGGDVTGAVALFEGLEATMPPEGLIARLIAPALTEAGERWFRRRCAVYQEHYVSGFLRHKLNGLLAAARRADTAPRHTALVGTVQGDRHEGGALIAAALLERAGWRVIYLGVDLPVAEYARAVEALRPDALALSFVLSRNINKRFQELSKLRGVPVYVGGRSILNYQGLARRYGLVPVPGPAESAVHELVRDYEARSSRGPGAPRAG